MSGTSKWLSRAIGIAVEAHADKVDKAGLPYIHHPLRVMELVRLAGGDARDQIVAVLHDVLEDHADEWSRERIAQRLFPEAIGAERDGYVNETLDLIVAIAHRDDETYAEYVRRVAEDGTLALVKWGDSTDNWARLAGLEPQERIGLAKRYSKNFEVLVETTRQKELRLLHLQEFVAA